MDSRFSAVPRRRRQVRTKAIVADSLSKSWCCVRPSQPMRPNVNRRYVPSLVAAIGDVIERHMREIGFLKTDESTAAPRASAESTPADANGFAGPFCPRCNQPGLLKEAGCMTCVHCGWSKCS
jgi:hypothetical protein